MTNPSRPSAAAAHPRVRRPGFGPEDLTDNEVAWVEFLRMISDGRDLHPTLHRVQLLRRVCGKF
ncbi:hypothetical protein DQW77_13780 [Roseovarius sp. TE539]|uniref:hypothetical protein n=1 Tax=Roseovarius sp. TE539 TaxID=2249812 RepID=UPI000DDDE878|nr:hypothetical protein [Roseovarius sp. TE539]RBI70610.1 hypothetical protein DQW77_13780 [Roseovarius sp. TE539]